jgi:hypothetical protein
MQKRGTISSVSLSGGENPTLFCLSAKYLAVVHPSNPDVPAIYAWKLPFGNCQVAACSVNSLASSVVALISGVMPSQGGPVSPCSAYCFMDCSTIGTVLTAF